MNMYECRFVDKYDKVFKITQYGNSEDELKAFWTQWWPKHYSDKVNTFVDCKLLQKDVKYDQYKEMMKLKTVLKIEGDIDEL